MLDEQRVMWLIGSGGGGLPLPLAFSTVVEEVLDHDYADFRRLEKVLSDALAFKEDRVLASPFRTWAGFAEGVISQLEAVGVLQELGGAYFIDKGFRAGVRITAIPDTNIWFQVHPKEERLHRERGERLLMDARLILAEFKRFGRYAPEELDEAGRQALNLLRGAEILAVQAEALLFGARAEIGTLELKPPRARKGIHAGLPSRPTPRELAASKYGLDGNPPSQSLSAASVFGKDGKRGCTKCHEYRLPEDFEVYTDGQRADWFLRGRCRGCIAEIKARKK